MNDKPVSKKILELQTKIQELENELRDLQSQQLETGNNIVTLIQHAETMNNVTDASGLLAEHVTDLENRLNIVIDWMKEEIRLRGLN
tara:strand:- start:3052 stop:3312 length:261 start_codon:yes stop_codon:yes gene_type:complete